MVVAQLVSALIDVCTASHRAMAHYVGSEVTYARR